MRSRPSRRRFLAGAAGLATLSACARKREARDITGGFADTDVAVGHRFRDGGLPSGAGGARRSPVVIVGGGVAGLAAAWRLRRAGCDDLTLLELGDAAGGTSRGGKLAGLAHPWGAHYLPLPGAHQRALVAFLEDAGIVTVEGGKPTTTAENLVRAPQERVAGLGHWQEGLWLRAGAKPEDHAQLAQFEALVEAQLAAGERAFSLPLENSVNRDADLDRMSAAEWADANGLRGARIRWYLEYATRDDFGSDLSETSAWALLHYFCARATGEEGESAEYLTWPEGNARLVQHLAAGLGERLATGRIATQVRPGAGDVEVTACGRQGGGAEVWSCDQLILATPQFLTTRLLGDADPAADARRRFRYAPWVVANLHLERLPTNRGFPFAWDNVLLDSPSLGYVDATHQLDRRDKQDTVWSWFLPLTGPDERAARTDLLARPWEHWRDAVLADLRVVHPDLVECVTRLDVWRWGHAMVKPTPGMIWGEDRRRAAASIADDRIHFANSDLSGVALFEEAHWQGVRAAEDVLAARGVPFESLL